MKNCFKFLIALMLGLGIGRFAKADSFSEATNSFQVAPTDQPSAYSLEFAKVSKKKQVEETPDTDQPSGTVFDNAGMFLQISSGYDFSLLEDITNGTSAWVKAVNASGGSVSGGGSNSGLLAGALWGFRLDPSSSVALDLGSVFTFGNGFKGSFVGGSVVQTTAPYLMSASLDYLLDIAKDKGSRIYLTVGAGWYHTIVDYNLNETTGIPFVGGSFSGDTVGGTLGVGDQVDLGGSFGLDLSVKVRYANFNKVSSNNATNFDAPGKSSLAIISSMPPYQLLIPVSDAGIASSGGTIRDATVDYSGIDAKVALNLYL
jgi:hypothetical protein